MPQLIVLIGVQAIYIVAVNDVFVVKAWKEAMGAKDSKFLHFLADDTAAVRQACRIECRSPPKGLRTDRTTVHCSDWPELRRHRCHGQPSLPPIRCYR